MSEIHAALLSATEETELERLRVEVVNARGDLGHAIEVIRKIVVRGGFGHWTWSLADSVLGKGESERLTREHYKRECAEET